MPRIELGGEIVEIDYDRDGLSLTSEALFMDGWWCLSRTDALRLECVLAALRAERTQQEAS